VAGRETGAMHRNLMTALVLTGCLSSNAPRNAPPLRVTALRCEHAANPLGIDEPRPRLSWIVESADRGARQKAYRLLVASSEERLRAGEGDLWDSGRVAGDDSVLVEYGGRALASMERAWWKVRVWGDGDVTVESEPAWWEMGLVRPEDWKASQWIGFEVPDPAPRPTLARAQWLWFPEEPVKGERFFRREVELPDVPIRSARFMISADDEFRLLVNGKESGSGRSWERVALVDVVAGLEPGRRNIIEVAVRNGGGPAGWIGQLRIDFEKGDPLVVDSGRTWSAAAAREASSWVAARELGPAGSKPWGVLDEASAALDDPGRCIELQKPFSLSAPVRRARLHATALGLYEAWLNGERIGRDVFTPGWTDYKRRVQYQTYDVTELLRRGRDGVLAVVLADGWYAGSVGWGGRRNHYGRAPRFRARLYLEYEDGTSTVIGTDESWDAAISPPPTRADFLLGESGDEVIPGWACNLGAVPATVDSGIVVPLVAQIGPPIQRTQGLEPVSLTEPRPGAWVFDLGQNMVGRVLIRPPDGSAGGQPIRLRFAEVLNPDGTIYTANLRGATSTDVCWLHGTDWEPRFTYHGFRYVEMTGWPGRPPLDAITGIVIHSVMPRAGTFECSSPMLNRLQENIVWGQRGNFLSVPTDCPQRDERLGWMGDAQVFAPTALLNADLAGFFTKWLVDVRDAQSPEGAFSDVSPRCVDLADGAPAWGDAGVIVPWVVWRETGDRRLLERSYDSMRRWVEYVRAGNPDLIWTRRVGNNYGDWVAAGSETPKDLLATAYFAQSASLLARAAVALGRARDAGVYRELASDIRAAFQRAFVQGDGRIHGDTQTAYALALRFDLVPLALRAAAARHLAADVERHDGHLTTGFLGVAHLLPALVEGGRPDLAWRVLMQESYPSWGYTIRHGATTIWERWDGWTEEKGFQDPEMNSFNHYAFGSVGEFLYRTVAGLDQDGEDAGWRRIVIRPHPGGGLTHARAEHLTPRGRAASAWRIEGDRFHLAVDVPVGSTAEVRLPARARTAILEGGAPVERASGVRPIRRDGDEAVFDVASGSYRFASTAP